MAIKLSSLKTNPNNPRFIKDAKFKQLVESIKQFPKMMALRPIIVDKDNIILGGNMRFKALQELGYKEIPGEWLKKADDLTEKEKKEFLIRDNISAGQWDWENLANQWEQSELLEWGFEPWNFGEIELNAEPETVQQNIDDLNKIKEQRKKGNESIVAKTDTEKYLVIVFQSREDKIALLKELDLPEDERYIPAGGVQIVPSGSWLQKFKSAAKNKSGATG
jgi:hypothetical protein